MNDITWLSLFGAGFAGSVVTILIKEIFGYFTENKKFKRELKRMVFQRKTEVVENAISWIQEAIDTYSMLQMACMECDKENNPATIAKRDTVLTKCIKLFEESPKRLNPLYLYYDFSDIIARNDTGASTKTINELCTLIVKFEQIETSEEFINYTEPSKQKLYADKKDASRSLAKECDCQIKGLIDMMYRLREDYSLYLK